jgi:leader peptidase (prepilin peptidase) / N-methyltransferase
VVTLLAVGAGLLGLVAGHLVNRLAGSFPWEGGTTGRRLAVRPPVIEVGTALLFVLAVLELRLSWELPAFLFLAAAGVLLTVIDLQHRLLPNRVVLPSIGIGTALLALAALAGQEWSSLLRAMLGAVVLFSVFLVLALIAPRGMGMGDVKLAALLGLALGWVSWGAVLVGAAAGFVVQAVVAVLLLASRRIGLRGELPFGPAMLLGAVLALGWSDRLLH